MAALHRAVRSIGEQGPIGDRTGVGAPGLPVTYGHSESHAAEWALSSPDDKLKDDLGNTIAATHRFSIVG